MVGIAAAEDPGSEGGRGRVRPESQAEKPEVGHIADPVPGRRPAQTRARLSSDRADDASIPGLPTTAMSVTGRCGAARPQTTDPYLRQISATWRPSRVSWPTNDRSAFAP